ncbi:Sensory transduction protein regX3 [compost metagenome]
MTNVLIVDDDQDIVAVLSIYLEAENFHVLFANNGLDALDIVKEKPIDIILLDVMMPEMNGFQFLKELRQASTIPVLFITAKNQSTDKILGLQLGADDYIEKPFDPLEVNARIMAILRRVNPRQGDEVSTNFLVHKNMKLNLDECVLYLNEQEQITLTSTEFKVLRLFMGSPGRVFTKQQIFEAGWDHNTIVDDNSIMVCISKLRSKLGEENPSIVSIRGLGYRMEKL